MQFGQLRKALAKLESIQPSDDYYRCAVFLNEDPEAASQMVLFSGDVMLVEVRQPAPKLPSASQSMLTTNSSRTFDKPLMLFANVPGKARGDDKPWHLPDHVHRCEAATSGRVHITEPVANRLAVLVDELSLSDFGNIRFHQCRSAGKQGEGDWQCVHLCAVHMAMLKSRGVHGWRDEVAYLRKKYNLPDTAGSKLL